MTNKETWIREVAQEIERPVASVKRAIKDTGGEINSKYDVVLCYAKWSVPKLKNQEKQEALYKKKIASLEQLIYDLQNVMEGLKVEYDEQMESKNSLIDTQNQIIAELKAQLRDLPLASGE